MFSSTDSEEEVEEVVRRPRVFKERLGYVEIEGTFDFNERFRLTATKMESILLTIGPRLQHSTERSHAISARNQLIMALRWLGTGVQYWCDGDAQGVSKCSVCRSVKRVVRAINDTLLQEFVKWPDDNPAGIAEDF